MEGRNNCRLACGCETRALKKTLDAWFARRTVLMTCPNGHGREKITAVDGPPSLKKLFEL